MDCFRAMIGNPFFENLEMIVEMPPSGGGGAKDIGLLKKLFCHRSCADNAPKRLVVASSYQIISLRLHRGQSPTVRRDLE